MWDALTGAELQQLDGYTPTVTSVAFSHDGTHIVSGSNDNSIRVWNRTHHSVLWTTTKDGWILSLPGQDYLMWMPQGIHEVIHHPYETLIISQKGYAYIDFQDCNLGTKWAKCYKPSLV